MIFAIPYWVWILMTGSVVVIGSHILKSYSRWIGFAKILLTQGYIVVFLAWKDSPWSDGNILYAVVLTILFCNLPGVAGLFYRLVETGISERSSTPPRKPMDLFSDHVPKALEHGDSKSEFQEGDFINEIYQIRGILGRGGYGVVYLVHSTGNDTSYAFKTIPDQDSHNSDHLALFTKEIQTWIKLDAHPNVVKAIVAERIYGRLYLILEYVPANKNGCNTLEQYLAASSTSLDQNIRWAVQVCQGMEYVLSKGIVAHRDLKPSNILITPDLVAKVSDFGLSGLYREGDAHGTVTHMPPEQFRGIQYCDQRSDVYALGIILFQMASGNRVPFWTPPPSNRSQASQAEWNNFNQRMYEMHSQQAPPRIISLLWPVIERCLHKNPDNRFQDFKSLRVALEDILRHIGNGAVSGQPKVAPIKAEDLLHKGNTHFALGEFEEAIDYFDRSLRLNGRSAPAWYGKGTALAAKERFREAIACFENALCYEPDSSEAWCNKADCHNLLSEFHVGLHCAERATKLDPQNYIAWVNKSVSLYELQRTKEALACSEKAILIAPLCAKAWYNKGLCLDTLKSLTEAVKMYEKTLEIDPNMTSAWFNKAHALDQLGQHVPAASSYRKFLQLADGQFERQIAFAKERLRHTG